MTIYTYKLFGFKIKALLVSCIFLANLLLAQKGNEVSIHSDTQGFKLKVDGKDTLIKGVVWDYEIIGENYSHDLWSESDEFIKEVLDYEMTLISNVGFNAIRSFRSTPPRWVEYIYKKWGIMYMPNHFMGRYGNLVNGTWIVPIDYSDPVQRKAIVEEIVEYMTPYVDTPGVIGYLLGNENNYGLEWLSHEIQELPKGNRDRGPSGSPLHPLRRIDKGDKRNRPQSPGRDCQRRFELYRPHRRALPLLGTFWGPMSIAGLLPGIYLKKSKKNSMYLSFTPSLVVMHLTPKPNKKKIGTKPITYLSSGGKST